MQENTENSIVQSLVRSADKGLILQPSKTQSSRRVVDIDDGMVRILNDHRMWQLESKILLGASFEDNDLVFPNSLGQLMNPMALARALNNVKDGRNEIT